MTLDQLEMIEAIVNEGSFQAAARKIHKSQPSLTNGVKKIEEFYGIQIFSREGYRPTLTAVGKRFYETSKSTLNSYRKLHKVASELGAGYEPEIKISIDPIVSSSKIPDVFKSIYSIKDKTSLSITEGVLFDNAHYLQKGEVDLAIGHLPQIDIENIESIKVCSVKLIPAIHKSLMTKNFNQQLLDEIPNIIVKSKKSDEFISPQTSSVKWYVDGHARKSQLISIGLGWGRVSESELETNELEQIPESIIEPLSFDIYLMRNSLIPQGLSASLIWQQMSKSHISAIS